MWEEFVQFIDLTAKQRNIKIIDAEFEGILNGEVDTG